MRLEVTDLVIREVRDEGERGYPREACGILAGRLDGETRTAVQALPIKNREETATRYLIPPKAYREAEEACRAKGLVPVGVYHSHPDHPASPSATDLDAAWPWFFYLIISVRKSRAGDSRTWLLREDRSGFEEVEFTIIEEGKTNGD